MASRRVETYVAYGVLAVFLVLVIAQVAVLRTASGGDYVIFGLMAVFGWWAWPSRRGRHIDHAVATAQASPEDIIVYWRPG